MKANGKRKNPREFEGFAFIDGSGWESNPPGAFADATPGLKPVAVTRAAYTPKFASAIVVASGAAFYDGTTRLTDRHADAAASATMGDFGSSDMAKFADYNEESGYHV